MVGSDADFNACPIEDTGSLKALIPNLLLLHGFMLGPTIAGKPLAAICSAMSIPSVQ